MVTIQGEKKEETKRENKTVHQIERRYGSFKRAFTLPAEIDVDKTDATYKNGVLKLTFPKVEKVKPKQIEVKVD